MKMPVISIAVIAAAGLIVGSLAGAFYIHGRLAPQVAVLAGRAEAVEVEKSLAEARLENLESLVKSLERQLLDTEARLAAVAERPQAEELVDQAFEPYWDELALAEAYALPEQTEPESGQTNPEREERGREMREQRAERMREFEGRAREHMGAVLEQAYANAPDADARERIQMMNEHMHQMAQWREDMRDAQTDEERDLLRQAMRESFGEIQQLTQDHQDAMIRDVAARRGITDPEQQDAFMRDLRRAQASPFFQAEGMFGGGRPPMRQGGGWTGGRGQRPR